jgi:hypothetical protein
MVEHKFELGQVVMTTSLQQTIHASDPENWQADLTQMLNRHVTGDWGEVPKEDKQFNDDCLERGQRLLSAYTSWAGVKVWIITKHDRSATTLLLPEDY